MIMEERPTTPYEKMIHHTLQEDTLASSQFELQADKKVQNLQTGQESGDGRGPLHLSSPFSTAPSFSPSPLTSHHHREFTTDMWKNTPLLNPSRYLANRSEEVDGQCGEGRARTSGGGCEHPLTACSVPRPAPFALLEPVRALPDPILRNCHVVLKRLSTADILKWQRPDTASSELVIPSASNYQSDESAAGHSSHLSHQGPANFFILSEQPMHIWNRKNRAVDHLIPDPDPSLDPPSTNEQILVATIISNKREKHWDQMEEAMQELKVARRCPSRKNPRNKQHQLNRTLEPHHTSKSLSRSCRKQRRGADFSLIYEALDLNMVCNSVEPRSKRGPSKGVNKAQTLPGNQTARSENSKVHAQNVFHNSQILDQEPSSESITPEPIQPKRIRLIETQQLLENVTAFHENIGSQVEGTLEKGNHAVDLIDSRPDESVPLSDVSEPLESPLQSSAKTESQQTAACLSAFPMGWFQRVPTSVRKPPTAHPGCCLSCYEFKVKILNQHCEMCRSKMKRLKHDYLKDPNTAIPQCTHQLNQPMRGCEACILRAFVLRYNLRNSKKSFTIPYDKVDSSIQRASQQVVPGPASTQIQNTPQDVSSHLFGSPKQCEQPKQKNVLDELQSLIKEICQDVLVPGPVSNKIQNTGQDVNSLPSLPELFDQPKHKVLYNNVGYSVQRTCQQVAPGLPSNQIQNTIHENTSAPLTSSPIIFSAFPNDWFLVVPDYANKPPTPHVGCCYSCYEYNERLHLQHCETCWSKAKRLKDNYLKDPKMHNPQCTHQLNLPMRGCDGCVLRAFVVRYNLRNPDACFAVPYNKVDQAITNAPPNNNFKNPFTSLLYNLLLKRNSMVTKTSREPVEPDAASNHIHNTPLDVTSLLSTMPKQWEPPHRFGFITNFPENWFLAVPDGANERPTSRFNQCVSCYEFKRTYGKEGHCETCRTKAEIIKDVYLKNPNTILPLCTHQLNQPMRCCNSCFLRAYILTYNISNPDEPYAIPYDKIDLGCQLLMRNHRSIKCEEEAPHYDSSELSIVSTQTLQSQPYPGTMFFPDGWFQKVPADIYELPTPRCGCCLSCYEYKTRVDGHCSGCTTKAKGLQKAYQKDPNIPIPQCTHHLNRPVRGCEVCIVRAYILRYNRSNPQKPFAIPYEMVDFGIPAHRIHQLIQPEKVFHQENHIQPHTPLDSSIDQELSNSPQNETSPVSSLNNHSGFSARRILEAIRQEIVFDQVQYDTVPKPDDPNLSIHQIQGSQRWAVRISVPFPYNWFLKISSDPNVPPTPRPSHCVLCYEFKKKGGSYCESCWSRLRRLRVKLKERSWKDLEKRMPQCEHQLNQPMRKCVGCFIRAFAFNLELRKINLYSFCNR